MRWTALILCTFSVSIGWTVEPVHPTDATLRDVEFIDPKQGWAVGDHGTAWYTVDGGRTVGDTSSWLLRAMPTQAMLTSVDMKPVEHIASRKSLPFTRGSTGQILVTADVGRNWQVRRTPTSLAGVRKIWLAESGLIGYAIGESSDAHPSGIAITTNGGGTWDPLAERSTAGWTASYCINDENILLGDAGGNITLLKSGRWSPTECQQSSRSAVRGFASGGGRIWAVGDKCQVLQSADGGMHWASVVLPVPAEAARVWHLSAVSAVANHIWAVGRPGSVVLHSADGGESWELQPTASAAPLCGVFFLDEQHGWAVGAMGTILATADSGKTWEIQRRADVRAGILWLSADDDSVPLGLVAKLCGDLGYRGVAVAMTSAMPDDAYPGTASRPERFAEAFRAVGGMCAETTRRFPMLPPASAPTTESTLKHWQTLYGDVNEEMRREIVLALRIWQPTFVVTDERPTAAGDPTPRSIIDKICRDACTQCTDAETYREQIDVLKLSPCPEPKILAMGSASSEGAIVAAPMERGRRLTEEFGVIEALASGRLSEGPIAQAEPVYLKLVGEDRPSDSAAAKEVESATTTVQAALDAVTPGSPGRRSFDATIPLVDPPQVPPVDLQNLARTFPTDPQQQFERLQELVPKAGEEKAGVLLYELGGELWKQGRPRDAKGVHDFLVVHLPDHPYAIPVYRQLLTYHVSSEIALTHEPSKDEDEKARLTKSLAYAAKLQDDGSFLLREPATALALASAGRRVDRRDVLRGYLAMMLNLPRSHAWRSVVDLEMWAIDRSMRSDRRILRAIGAVEPPYLDGQLDDKCWQDGRSATLDGRSIEVAGRFQTEIRVQFDEEYLYVAANCDYPDPSFKKEPAVRTGPDADLSAQDRLILAIDVDRDYGSFFQFAVDARGLVADQKAGDASWNPKWFVATTTDDHGWRAEIAIPLAELPDAADLAKRIWAFNIVRVVPGHAVLSLTGPTAAEIRGEDCTLLTFGSNAASKSPTSRAN